MPARKAVRVTAASADIEWAAAGSCAKEGTEVMLPAPDGEGLSGGMIDGVLFAGSAPVACVSSFRGVE